MIKKAQYLLFIILTLILFNSCINNIEIDENLPLQEKIDQLVEPVVTFGSPSAIIIGVIKDGEKSIYSYGDAGLGFGAPQSNTIFEIGSNTKTFTALLLSDFISEGLMSLDDPINQYLPGHVNPPQYKGENITLRHLVTHTSGLPRSAINFDLDPNIFWSDFTNEDFYTFLNDISVQAYPFDDYTNGNELPYLGTKYRYSNIGTGVLGHILELASGQTYEELIEERICSELDMPDTKIYVDLTEEQKSRIPKAYNINQYEQEFPRDFGRCLAQGAILSTMDDMLNYMEANLENSGSLSESMQRCHTMIFTKEDLTDDGSGVFERFPYEDAGGIGMIWYVSHIDGDTIVEHGGDYNHHCTFKFNKTQKAGIIMFSNTANVSDAEIKEQIFNWITE